MLDALHMLQIDRKIQYVLFGMKMNTHMRLQSEDSDDDNITPVNQNRHCGYIAWYPQCPPGGGASGYNVPKLPGQCEYIVPELSPCRSAMQVHCTHIAQGSRIQLMGVTPFN